MQKVYMLTEEEYSMLQGQTKYIEVLQKDNAELQRRLNNALAQNREMKRDIEGTTAHAADLSRKLRDAQALLGLVPDDALTIAKLTQLASMGK